MSRVIRLSSDLRGRVRFLVLTTLYTFVIAYAHAGYLNAEWGYYGFSYYPMGAIEWACVGMLIFVAAIVVPIKINKPSALISLVIFIVVIVPTVTLTLGLNANRIDKYLLILVALVFGYVLLCKFASVGVNANEDLLSRPLSKKLEIAFAVSWLLFAVILVLTYRSTMRFSGLDEIYEQRAIGTAASSTWLAYIQTYFVGMLTPAMLAFGLVKRKRIYTLIGWLGFMIIYLITAQKASLLTPFAMHVLHYVLTKKTDGNGIAEYLLGWWTIVIVISLLLADRFSILVKTALFRTIGLPGLTLSQYYDVFSDAGYTWWSHVKGISLLVHAPTAFSSDPAWPNLGYIIGDRVYGNLSLNANANLFAWDGVSAAGIFGILLIGVIAGLWLRFYDRVSRSYDKKLVILTALPFAILLTNGGLFTVLVSFGAGAWMLVFLGARTNRS